MTETDLSALVGRFDDLADRIAPAARRRMGRLIAQDMRATNAQRIRPNAQPDGEAMIPRKARSKGQLRAARLRDAAKSRKRLLRRGRMFRKAAGALKRESTTDEAQVGFIGAMARIMAVHQYGQADHVTRDPSSPLVTYPARVVLGINPDDRARILERVTAQLEP